MRIKRHNRKVLVTDLYTLVDENKEQFYFVVYSNGKGVEISSELRTQDGTLLNKEKLKQKIKKVVLSDNIA